MREAGVDLVTVGVFSWALLEPESGRFELDWLGRVLDRLADGGVGVDLATATASPPPWLPHRHPETLPVTAHGTRLSPGGRQAYCPSSPVYREPPYGSPAPWRSGSVTTQRCRCGTSATSTPATTRTATATSARRRSGLG